MMASPYQIRLVVRNIPADDGAISPFTPASSNASLAALAAKVRSLLALPFGMLHLFDRVVLTRRIRTFPFGATLKAKTPDWSFGFRVGRSSDPPKTDLDIAQEYRSAGRRSQASGSVSSTTAAINAIMVGKSAKSLTRPYNAGDNAPDPIAPVKDKPKA